MSTEVKRDLPRIVSLDDVEKLAIPYETRLLMVAVTPAHLKQIMTWVDSRWRDIEMRRKKYDEKVGGKLQQHKTIDRPELIFVAAKA